MPIKDEPEPKHLEESFEDFRLPTKERSPHWKEFIVPVLCAFALGAILATAFILMLEHRHML